MQRKKLKKVVFRCCLLLGVALLLWHASIVLRIVYYRFYFPTSTALIDLREDALREHGKAVARKQNFVPITAVSRPVIRAILAGEDARYFHHAGIDFEELEKSLERNWKDKKFTRGASTISQQLAKNLFLSPSKNPLRKLHEVLITAELELLLGKRRILEIYVNVIEFGNQLYGVEAAARRFFGQGAAHLDAQQAAFLAAVIPGPLSRYNPKKNPSRVQWRSMLILRMMDHVELPRGLQ